jgi:hypothetical protein
LAKLATITQARSVVSLSFCPKTAHMSPSIPWCPLVFGSLGPRCNSLLSHILSLPFPFFVLCCPQSWVIIRVFGFACVRSSALFYLSVPVSDSQCFDEKPLKKEILYKCTLYPSALPFPLFLFLPRFLPFFLFVITSYPAQLISRWYPYLCKPFAKGPPSCPLLHLQSLARSYIRLIYPSFFRALSFPLPPSYPRLVEIFMLDVSRVLRCARESEDHLRWVGEMKTRLDV